MELTLIIQLQKRRSLVHKNNELSYWFCFDDFPHIYQAVVVMFAWFEIFNEITHNLFKKKHATYTFKNVSALYSCSRI